MKKLILILSSLVLSGCGLYSNFVGGVAEEHMRQIESINWDIERKNREVQSDVLSIPKIVIENVENKIIFWGYDPKQMKQTTSKQNGSFSFIFSPMEGPREELKLWITSEGKVTECNLKSNVESEYIHKVYKFVRFNKPNNDNFAPEGCTRSHLKNGTGSLRDRYCDID